MFGATLPDRGDIMELFSENKTAFYAIALSHKSYNRKTGLVISAFITLQPTGYPFEVLLPQKVRIPGAVVTDQIRTLDWQSRRSKIIGHVSDEILDEVLGKLEAIIF